MTGFRTMLPPIEPPFGLGYADRTLALGSCFAEHIGGRLREHKLPTLVNPFGIVYNPRSVARALRLLSGRETFDPEAVFERQQLWNSYDFHGRFAHTSREEARTRMLAACREGQAWLASANRLLLTFGTAYAYEHKATGRVVANCHRMPAETFRRRRLTVEEAFAVLAESLEPLRAQWPDTRVIVSVSPVRHLRDGLVANQRSKAVLTLLAERLAEAFPQVCYYPAYELLLDDLRDYRFYAADLTHPREEAIAYIWEHFLKSFLPEGDRALLERVRRLRRAAAHRPFHPERPAHQAFLRKQLDEVEALARERPDLDWAPERERFQRYLLA